ncbi:hypothetical protein B0H19DRAFT_1150331 [Mycena capillaripes]|nr:hypothetical protein B0H19DRAFT_1150331 [Mycena capillaripes]
MERLPLELLSDILLECLPPLPEPRVDHFPMLLLNVCSTWTDIALSIPHIWTAIKITFPGAGNFKGGVRAWLQRARDLPLSISLVGPAFDRGVMGIIWEHGQQLKHLEMCYEREEDEDSDDESPERIDFLGGKSPGPLPLLKTLTIRRLSSLYDGQGYSGLQFLELLGLAPNLSECVFDRIQPLLEVAFTTEKLVLPVLRRLTFDGEYEMRSNSERIFNCLTLPVLEVLSLPICSDNDLFIFLERSSPPLKQLVMGRVFSQGENSVRLQECLHLVPTLTDLTVWNPDSRLTTELSAALADSSSLLPNLHTFRIIKLYGDVNPDSFWETLLRALLTRRRQLEMVRVELANTIFSTQSMPSAGTLAALRALEVEGMQIYIGDHGHDWNYVSRYMLHE